jgi:hypothetical protein
MSALGICAGCKRFARGDVCPFCGADVGAPRSRTSGRRARNGVLALAITAACGGTTLGGSDASMDAVGSDAADAKDDMAPIPFYGAVPLDSGTDSGDAGDGG